jgi:hypothetical protein
VVGREAGWWSDTKDINLLWSFIISQGKNSYTRREWGHQCWDQLNSNHEPHLYSIYKIKRSRISHSTISTK